MEKDSKTTVAVERTTFAKLDRLAKANSVSKMEYITHAINYFEKYGINPVEHESPAQEMQKLIKRMDQVFAFLKKQETDLVRPACEALAGASTQITISLSSLLSEEKFRRFLKDNKELLAGIINSSDNNGKADRQGRKSGAGCRFNYKEEPGYYLQADRSQRNGTTQGHATYRFLPRCKRKDRAAR